MRAGHHGKRLRQADAGGGLSDHNRGGLGIKNYMVTDKTGPVVGIKVVDGTEDLLLVTQAGILIRTPVDSIRTAGRATQASSSCGSRRRGIT